MYDYIIWCQFFTFSYLMIWLLESHFASQQYLHRSVSNAYYVCFYALLLLFECVGFTFLFNFIECDILVSISCATAIYRISKRKRPSCLWTVKKSDLKKYHFFISFFSFSWQMVFIIFSIDFFSLFCVTSIFPPFALHSLYMIICNFYSTILV